MIDHQATPIHVPYANRHWKAKTSQFFYIQPFADRLLSTEEVELILDNNAFIESTTNKNALLGAICLPDIRGVSVNPFPALVEQWVSNSMFWSNRDAPDEPPRSQLISDYLTIVGSMGVKHLPNYPALMINQFRSENVSIRNDLGILFGYIAAIRSIQKKKLKLTERIQQFRDLLSADIPRFNGLIGLAVLTFYFQDNRTVKDETGKLELELTRFHGQFELLH